MRRKSTAFGGLTLAILAAWGWWLAYQRGSTILTLTGRRESLIPFK